MQQLRDEFEYYLEHQSVLAERYNGKFIVIKNQEVLGEYDDQMDAINVTAQEHDLGTFLVQKCDPDPESTMQTFHSRAYFS